MSFMNYISERKIAGFFTGVATIGLIALGQYSNGMILAIGLMAFFTGESHGIATASTNKLGGQS